MTVHSPKSLAARLQALPKGDDGAARAVAERELHLTKPQGALGRLETLTAWLARWQGQAPPRLERLRVAVFAGNHGVAARGVSAYPASVTAQMVANFERGGAAVNQLAKLHGAELHVAALALETPTADFTSGPALDAHDFEAAVIAGEAAVEPGLDLLAIGEMGIANTTAAAAVAAALLGGRAADWVGPGTGIDVAALWRKARIVEEAVARHREADNPLEVLRRLGGRELVAMAAAVLKARELGVPVLLDGFVCTAAVLPLVRVADDALEHCQLGHVSAEPGHRRLVQALGLRPLLDLDMRLGEASGAALAIAILKAALACHTGMTTFAEAAVEGRQG
ncbi:MAG: nicotinate-nucleotide--dimethylbenzimidazole phosphoribosyltransferase [Geminicoccaceae bacterium]|nr:MAG: nicotinate-nucleotide--dimethylbenzimidazole phosphoribosyltransferase [Geminicoccaceae bacterium]